MAINWKRLTDYFEASDLEWKPIATTKDKKKGLAAAYVTARAIQARLDEVFTPGGWKNEYRAGPDGGVICRIYFRNEEGEWVWREDGAENTDIEAVKGGLSNALKRAGSALGIGRYLYELPEQWVALNQYGRFEATPAVPRQFLPQQHGDGGGSVTNPHLANTYPEGNELSVRDLYAAGRKAGYDKEQVIKAAYARFEKAPELLSMGQLQEAIDALKARGAA